jgi:repressor LexA
MANNINDRIKRARNKAGITQGELAKQLGIAYPTLNKYERGHRIPDAALLSRMVKVLGCDPGWLLVGESGETRRQPVSEAIPVARIPVLKKIPDDFPEHVSEEIADYISFPDVPEGAYALIVKGESMSPMIRDGDYVIFMPGKNVRNGEMVVVNNEWDESILRRYRKKKGEVLLVSDNPEYPITRLNGQYEIIGKVIVVWRKVKI